MIQSMPHIALYTNEIQPFKAIISISDYLILIYKKLNPFSIRNISNHILIPPITQKIKSLHYFFKFTAFKDRVNLQQQQTTICPPQSSTASQANEK